MKTLGGAAIGLSVLLALALAIALLAGCQFTIPIAPPGEGPSKPLDGGDVDGGMVAADANPGEASVPVTFDAGCERDAGTSGPGSPTGPIAGGDPGGLRGAPMPH